MSEYVTLLTCDEMRSLVERIFARMRLLFGKRWSDQWYGVDDEKLKNLWCSELGRYSDDELRRGMEEVRKLNWPPSLPEFKKLCRPPIDELVAYYEAINGLQERKNGNTGVWSHPAIFFSATRLYFDLMHKSYSEVKDRWAKELKMQLEKGDWPPIPKAMPALEYKPQPSRDVALHHLRHIRQILDMQPGLNNDRGTISERRY